MNAKKIGQRLRTMRGSRTLENVARALNLTPAAIGMYERGERIPRDEIKAKLAVYYNTTVGEIFFNADDTDSCERVTQ